MKSNERTSLYSFSVIGGISVAIIVVMISFTTIQISSRINDIRYRARQIEESVVAFNVRSDQLKLRLADLEKQIAMQKNLIAKIENIINSIIESSVKLGMMTNETEQMEGVQ